MVSNQILNAMSELVVGNKAIFSDAFALKEIRARLTLLGVPSLPLDTVFPGDLVHVTVPKVLALLAALDSLDGAFFLANASSGIPPIKAIVDMIP